jgi:hypothetical protein
MSDQRDNAGTLSRNKKREHDKQPEYRGSCTIDGVSYWLSAWVKDGDDGKFFSLAFTRKEQQSRAPAGVSGPGPGHRCGVLDDEIPFMAEWR